MVKITTVVMFLAGLVVGGVLIQMFYMDLPLQTRREERRSRNSRKQSCPSVSSAAVSTTKQSGSCKATYPHDFMAKYGTTKYDTACDNDLGFGLVKRFRQGLEDWCTPDDGISSIACSRIQQTRHVAEDTMCFGKNVVIDYSKIRSVTAEGAAIDDGAFVASCNKKSKYNAVNFQLWLLHFMPLLETRKNLPECDQPDTRTTIFVGRDGSGNVFHSMVDFFSVFLSLAVAEIDPQDTRVVLLDTATNGPYWDQWKVFSGGEEPLRASEMNNRVCYSNAVFALPAGSAPLWKDIWISNDCFKSDLLKAYTRYVLDKLGLLEEGSGEISTRDENWTTKPKVTLSVRQHKPGGRIGRSMINQDELEAIVRSNDRIESTIVDLGTVPYMKQLEIIRNTEVYVGMHGAGMAYIPFLPERAVVVEFFPKGWHQSSMRNLARWTGHAYFAWACSEDQDMGPELATRIPPDVFKRMVNKGLHAYWSGVYNGLENDVPFFA